jgi:hypothetical protein
MPMADDKGLMDDFDEQNAAALAEMLADPQTSEAVRLQIINEILESERGASFFDLMVQESMTLGNCPNCKHRNHWLVPEEELNIRGWITHEEDSRCHQHTNEEICPEFSEACMKKRVTA